MHTPHQARCVYHPNRVAVEKCEKCGNLICLECKMTRRVKRVDEADSVYTFCPPCYQTAQKQSRRFGIIAIIIFIVVAAIIIIIFLTMASNIMSSMPEIP